MLGQALLNQTDRADHQAVWSLYIIETRFGHWYTGITTDVERRFHQHQSGKGAKNLRGKGPLVLKFQFAVGSRRHASKLEWQVKQLTKAQKVQLVESKGERVNDKIKSLMSATPA
ncbi:GIY-YIG nuclease family protein [Pseudoalteromonas peptidolytica]|uniref:GIY-YIG nuclease family protein n=1 Tax=Pseudoalteromonas TaxID=53246 RepID=UPI0019D44FE7|nr:GIY-YIG nuclease family protein [Pseudoalteromonas peptidolytica]MDW7548045.1 GIY-YIG nuclease family protein [Pseudoalteromonas peptidolytica]USD27364.1 GIY-YIG nuclease family protein [Pseudoalteromonas sp. SCSIO 43201]